MTMLTILAVFMLYFILYLSLIGLILFNKLTFVFFSTTCPLYSNLFAFQIIH